MQVTITKIFDKERTSKAGKPFTSRAIKTNEHGEKWLSGFKGKENEGWREGDTVEIEITQNGEYLNYAVPKGSFQKGGTSGDVNRVEMKLDALRAEITTIGAILTDIKGVLGGLIKEKDYPEPSEPTF